MNVMHWYQILHVLCHHTVSCSGVLDLGYIYVATLRLLPPLCFVWNRSSIFLAVSWWSSRHLLGCGRGRCCRWCWWCCPRTSWLHISQLSLFIILAFLLITLTPPMRSSANDISILPPLLLLLLPESTIPLSFRRPTTIRARSWRSRRSFSTGLSVVIECWALPIMPLSNVVACFRTTIALYSIQRAWI